MPTSDHREMKLVTNKRKAAENSQILTD
jgi:hypothetical protein